jgi:hypothetical protein
MRAASRTVSLARGQTLSRRHAPWAVSGRAVAAAAIVAWLGLTYLAALRHGEHRRATFNSAARRDR